MASEPIDFEPLNSVNARIVKYLQDSTLMSTGHLNPRRKKILILAREAYENGNYNEAISFYKLYMTESLECEPRVHNTEHLNIVIQYLIAKCLLYSDQFQDLVEARKILNDLEPHVADKYPMILYALAEFYLKVFCFEEAADYSNRCFSVLNPPGKHVSFPMCFIPESNIFIPESTLDDLKTKLNNLTEQCSGWHPPDAKCFMNNCTAISPHHISGRNIFMKSPAFNGMVTIICNNIGNPCTIRFHNACWKVKKDETSSPLKISDKEILLKWVCFTPNCGINNQQSLIQKIIIHKEDGTTKCIEPHPDKSNWHAHQSNCASKGAIRKQRPMSKCKNTSKTLKTKPYLSNEKIDDNCASVDYVCSNGHDNENCTHPDAHETLDSIRVREIGKCRKSPRRDPFAMKVLKMRGLRLLNFNTNIDHDWKPNKAYYGNGHMKDTIRKGYEPDFSDDSEEIACLKSFLFSYFQTYIEHNGPIKDDELMREWNNVTSADDFKPLIKNLTSIIDIRQFLLESFVFVAIGDYICIPALLPGAYSLVEADVCLKLTEMLQKATQQSAESVRKDEQGVVEKSGEKAIDLCETDSIKTDDYEFLLSPNDFMYSSGESDSESESHCESGIEDNDSRQDEGNSRESIDDEEHDQPNTNESINSVEKDNDHVQSIKADHSPDVSEQDSLEVDKDRSSILQDKSIRGDDSIWGSSIVSDNTIMASKRKNVNDNILNDLKPGGYLQRFADQYLGETSCNLIGNQNQSLKSGVESLSNDSTRLVLERNVIESESEQSLTDDDNHFSKMTTGHTECLQCTECRCNEIAELKSVIKTLQSDRTKLEDKIRNLTAKIEGKETYYKNKLLEKMNETLDCQYQVNETLISSKIELLQNQYDIISKIQNLLFGTTRNVINVDQREWAEALEKLDKLHSNTRQEYKKLRGLILLEKNSENSQNELTIRMNSIQIPHLPQKNLPELIEVAFEMMRNHYQQSLLLSYQASPFSQISIQAPPIMSSWYQQPEYAHSMVPSSNSIQSLENYQRLVSASAPSIFVNPVVSGQPRDIPGWPSTSKNSSNSYNSHNEIYSPSDIDVESSSTDRNVPPASTQLFTGNHSEKTVFNRWLLPASSKDEPPIQNSQKGQITINAGFDSETQLAQDGVGASKLIFKVKTEEDDKAPLQSPVLPKWRNRFIDCNAKLRKPLPRVHVEIPRKPKDSSIAPLTKILSRVLSSGPTDATEDVTKDLLDGESSIKRDRSVSSSINTEDELHSSEVSSQSEQTKPSSVDIVESDDNRKNEKGSTLQAKCGKKKIKSIDKVMAILRTKHPYALEYDLIWSIQLLRRNKNDSLTGLPLSRIIEEVGSIIQLRQKLQVIGYHSNIPRNCYTQKQSSPCPLAPNEQIHSAAATGCSSSQTEYSADANPWRKPKDVTWKKESPEADCVICFEALQMHSQNLIYTLTCQHTFHKKCITNWFKQNRTCPTCRVHTTLEDEFPPLP